MLNKQSTGLLLMSELFKFSLDLNVLNHLGLGLYSSTPAVLTEIIANAYDADATNVQISLDSENGTITIVDDGHGMTAEDVREKFLTVGYARRDYSPTSTSGTRRVMGRKGIGKLAMFSLANIVELTTKTKDGSLIAVKVDVEELKSCIQNKQEYPLENITPSDLLVASSGTILKLTALNKTIKSIEENLKQRLSRRFSVIGSNSQTPFNIVVNNNQLTLADRGFHHDVQFFWSFGGEEATANLALCDSLAIDTETKAKRIMELSNQIGSPKPEGGLLNVRGYIASVKKPRQLKGQDSNINQISIFANGRVFQEDVLPDLSNSDHFNNYLVGEIHADFLDQDNVDRATASREAIKRSDPFYMALTNHLKKSMKEVSDAWDKWRKEIGYENLPDKNPAVEQWLNTLSDKRDRNIAEKLIMSIYNVRFAGDDSENKKRKQDLYRSTIVGFEKLKARQNLDRLSNVHDVLSHEFQIIFQNINDMEETYYWDITTSRLEIIKKFEKIVKDKALEKVAQEYLFNNLWLLDPTWDRVSDAVTEKVLTAELKKIDPAAEGGARLDIAYRTSAGRQIVIELKRPGLTNIDFYKLLPQVTKYRKAIAQYIREHPDFFPGMRSDSLPIEICILLEIDITQGDEDMKNHLKAAQARIITYEGLIQNSLRIYEHYTQAHQKVSLINDLVKKI